MVYSDSSSSLCLLYSPNENINIFIAAARVTGSTEEASKFIIHPVLPSLPSPQLSIIYYTVIHPVLTALHSPKLSTNYYTPCSIHALPSQKLSIIYYTLCSTCSSLTATIHSLLYSDTPCSTCSSLSAVRNYPLFITPPVLYSPTLPSSKLSLIYYTPQSILPSP